MRSDGLNRKFELDNKTFSLFSGSRFLLLLSLLPKEIRDGDNNLMELVDSLILVLLLFAFVTSKELTIQLLLILILD